MIDSFQRSCFLICVLIISFANSTTQFLQAGERPFFCYNFGGLENYTPRKQIEVLHQSNFDGICLQMAKTNHVQNLDSFIIIADELPNFKIYAAFIRFNFNDNEDDKSRWRTVVDKIAGKGIDLWVIFGKPETEVGDEQVEVFLREIVEYAADKKVTVTLYPHSHCYFYSAEQALPMVKKINHPNLGLAVHTCHELRAGNGHRLDEVVLNVQDYLRFVTIAGADEEVDRTSPRTMDKSTLKSLRNNNFDFSPFVKSLKQIKYKGSVGFINFKVDDAGEVPEKYLPESRKEWRKMSKGL